MIKWIIDRMGREGFIEGCIVSGFTCFWEKSILVKLVGIINIIILRLFKFLRSRRV